MTFEELLDRAIALLQRRGRLTYRTLKRQFGLDDAVLEGLKEELIYGQRLAVDEEERVLVWIGESAAPPQSSGGATAPATSQAGTPLAHEDHAVRACYAALAMQAAVQQYAAEVQRRHGVPLQMRAGLNAGELVVRAIGNDLHMDYPAIGQTTRLAARMEQMAMPGSILVTPAVLGLAEGYVHVKLLGSVPVKGLEAPVEVYELVGASGYGGACRRRGEGSPVLSAATPNWWPWDRPWSMPRLAMGRWWRSSARPAMSI
jgi:class 3 adenylate cyclase